MQFTENAVRIYGTDNFPGSVLITVGVDRPAAQRFTDKAYIEVASTDHDLSGSTNFAAADADIVYVSFDSAAAKDRAPTIFDSDAWRRLAAARDNRVFVVNNESGRPVRAWWRPAASSTTCAGSTRPSISRGVRSNAPGQLHSLSMLIWMAFNGIRYTTTRTEEDR